MSATDPVISIRHLAKEFRSVRRRLRALDDVDLDVFKGEVFGLLGANGAGKTTLVKVLLGLSRPTSGTVRLRGVDPREAKARRRVGYLPEGHRFPDYLSGVETLRVFGRLAGTAESLLDSRAASLLDLVGLGGRGADRVGKYSKGMIQRLGLACALIDEPEILFLDEPTDGVDPVGRRHIRDVLRDVAARGTTIFLNSHLLSEVERTCDRVAILDRGRVVREGSIAELTSATVRYRLRLAEPVDLATLPTLSGVTLTSNNGWLEADATDVPALNRLIDTLRERGALVTELTPLKSDLEDVFINLVAPESKR